ncbi:hypothetical protein UF75_3738 [Desulfosporosinus sp. I2]|uniref:Flp family type IVb pilin n=1 Tax=Desulfosporosinus sp. I2 TaxID=1617025 RepID=UPI00061F471A|nr:Flp family type IVb pilin [Desulfosporosinus sp. I2]KJR45867.1 hypothetical protein UF75_3738 [Desulfosporosinus sp. I2]
MKEKLVRLIRDEEGQGMVEYGLIIGLVAIVIVAALATMSGSITGIFDRISAALDGV